MSLRLGSLFSGYGGLEVGIAQVLDVEPAWHSEIEPGPIRVLERHWPGVPNLGDVTAVDWATVPPVDILCGGFPCQDVSLAGLRRGLRPDTRSGLWSHFAAAIDALRPSLVVIENVRGLLSAEAHSDLEPDAWDLGAPGGSRGPALRALGAVLGDLADLGYDAEWLGVRASDAGAPHSRFRVFVVAHPADARGETGRLGTGLRAGRPSDLGRGRSDDRRLPIAPADADAERRRAGLGDVRAGEPDSRGGTATDPDGKRHGGGEDPRVVGGVDGPDAGAAREWERARCVAGDRGAQVAPDTADDGLLGIEDAGDGQPVPRGSAVGVPGDGGCEVRARTRAVRAAPASGLDWGGFEPAVRRWEGVSARAAPAPTEVSSNGNPRLSPRFVEWMMGLPDGHVTGSDVGLKRREQLKALGNGVVPQQAALALRTLLAG